MNDLIQSFTLNTVLFGVAAVIATKAYKWIAPILLGGHKGETLPERVKRVADEQERDRIKQRDLNMGRERALHVRSINVGVLFAFMVLVGTVLPRVGFPFKQEVVLAFGAYVIVGYLAGLLFKVVPAEVTAGLNWHSRVDVRLYYVWLWPLNVYKRIARNH